MYTYIQICMPCPEFCSCGNDDTCSQTHDTGIEEKAPTLLWRPSTMELTMCFSYNDETKVVGSKNALDLLDIKLLRPL